MKKAIKRFVLAITMGITAVSASAQALTIGGKGFTESLLIVEITKQYLTSKGFSVEAKTGLGTAVVRKALLNGQLDMYWEYTGPALVNFHKKPGVPRQEMVQALNELDAPNHVKWLPSSDVNNTYALAMNKDVADELGIKDMSDLSRVMKEGKRLKIAVNAEFYARKDGMRPMEEFYELQFPREDIVRMDSGLTYNALKDRKVDIALVFATDGRIPAFNFMLIKDNKNYHVAQDMTPVVRLETLGKHPELEQLLRDISSKLDSTKMSALNAQVDVDRKTPEQVAADFLSTAGLM
ncbi:glycine betaine ABC transporter substrate-binding protein [Alcaligenes nematophilus]|uniref:glycine betaine ABC transporter substrate-binding protein n=1 Tax=Alcaligenes nematophilus TaxID=2994643 RepID=UPI002460A223|nr:glycine betaine ABC transporter substrate-binding protein [Alcaligenes nematophilus]MDH4865416.1 glycine/betaine ABC transporter substrate-binding protein [Bacillus cereus]MDY7126715.1 glycine betaine ABC transporter substrate-binding protein [Alcaligenes nematophilus]